MNPLILRAIKQNNENYLKAQRRALMAMRINQERVEKTRISRNIVDGIIPKKKSLNSSKTTPLNTGSLPTYPFVSLVVKVAIAKAAGTATPQPQESFNTFLQLGRIPKQDG